MSWRGLRSWSLRKVDVVLGRDSLFAVRKYESSVWVLLSFGRLFLLQHPKSPAEGKALYGGAGSSV